MKVELIDSIPGFSFVFSIKDLPRFILQELARHRVSSFSVQSSRYTLGKKLKNETTFFNGDYLLDDAKERASKYIRLHEETHFHVPQIKQLEILLSFVKETNHKSDDYKYLLPETWFCDLIWTVDTDSLVNFIELRTNSSAHKDIRELANKIKELIT